MQAYGQDSRVSQVITHCWRVSSKCTRQSHFVKRAACYKGSLASSEQPGLLTNTIKMAMPGIVFFLLLACCFQFLLSRRRQRTQGVKSGCAEDESTSSTVFTDQTSCKSHESPVIHKERRKPTRITLSSRASHFSGPQNLSGEDKLWLQAFRYGVR